ncbi:hypothetical protein [Kitasatospora sp. NPDC004289]
MDQKTRLRRTVAVAGLLLALGTATACGSATTSGSTAPGDVPAGTPSTTASASASASPSNPEPRPSTPPPVKVSPTPTPTATTPGIAVGEPDPNGKAPGVSYRVDGLRLTVTFYGGVCEKYGLKLDESKPGTVQAKVVVREPQPAGQACAAIAKLQEVSADLKTQLEGRTVFDQNTGQELPRNQGPDEVGGPKH